MSHPRDPRFPEYSARPPAENPRPEPGPPPPFPNMRPVESVPHGGASTLATVALVLGLVGAVLAAIPLAIVALVRISDRNQTGRWKAVVGLVAAVVWIPVVLVRIAGIADDEPDRDVASGQVTAAQTTRPQDLKVGDCVADLEQGAVKRVTVKPCDQPNGGRVFAVFTFPPGSWPGSEAVDEQTDDGCWERWSASNEQVTDPSDIFILGPTEDSWRLGDRGVTCLVIPR
jgi:putative regulator of septum formation